MEHNQFEPFLVGLPSLGLVSPDTRPDTLGSLAARVAANTDRASLRYVVLVRVLAMPYLISSFGGDSTEVVISEAMEAVQEAKQCRVMPNHMRGIRRDVYSVRAGSERLHSAAANACMSCIILPPCPCICQSVICALQH